VGLCSSRSARGSAARGIEASKCATLAPAGRRRAWATPGTANYASAVVPLWKRALSRAITAVIRAAESPKQHRRADVPLPTDDPWYESHEALDTIQPGTLLANRPVEFRAGSHWVSHARAWQLRYRSTDTVGQAISAVATLMVPERAWAGVGPRPLVSYQGAIDSLGPRADPSYTFRKGSQKEFLLMTFALRHG
jgi:hypothetical protein